MGDICEFCGKKDDKTRYVIDLKMRLCKRHQSQYYEMGKLYKRTKYDLNEIIVNTDYAEVVLYDKDHEEIARSKIDLKDVKLVKRYKWNLTPQNYCRNASHEIALHNLIMGDYDTKNFVIDHINRDRLDNRRSNLRVVDYSMNGFNKGKQSNNTSGHVGVSWEKRRNKWEAHIKINKKKKFLGYFDDIDDAIKARRKAEIEYYGEIRDSKYDINTVYKTQLNEEGA